MRIAYLTLVFGSLSLIGCASDDDDDAGNNVPLNANVRALHLSPDAPRVDVLVNGSIRAFEDLPFTQSTTFAELEEGGYDFDIVPTGGVLGDSVGNVSLTLDSDTWYTAVAFDNAANLQLLSLIDTDDILDSNNIRVRAIHTAVGVGEVDIYNLPPGGTPGLLYENVGFGDAGDAIDLPAGAYILGLDVDDDGNSDLTFTLPALDAGTVANIFAVNDGADVFLLAQFLDGSTASIAANP